MAIDSKSENTIMRLWLLMHRVRDALFLCEGSVFEEYGLTTEQFTLLAAVKGAGGNQRPSELATLMDRSPNSVSMLVDRMVKAGLVRRTRDRKDRRVVNVMLTNKGEEALEPSIVVGWELVKNILSPLSDEDKNTLANLLEIVKCECFGYLNPGVNIAEIRRNSITNRPDLYKQMVKSVFPHSYEAKRQGVRKKKAI
jgi:DNA-binding MarR family transcriptional regulator